MRSGGLVVGESSEARETAANPIQDSACFLGFSTAWSGSNYRFLIGKDYRRIAVARLALGLQPI